MNEAFICDAIRTPIGRYGGTLASVRADDLGAVPLKALMARNPQVDWAAVEDIIYGCANQAGEDNRNVARMSGLLAGLPIEVPGTTVNRLCGSGMDAVGLAARSIKSAETDLMIAGGVESMSRAPFVMGKAESAFSRQAAIYDTTIGWRFVNPLMKKLYGVDSMPETAENVATDFKIEREAQDQMALRSQLNAVRAQQCGYFDAEIVPVTAHGERRRADRTAMGHHDDIVARMRQRQTQQCLFHTRHDIGKALAIRRSLGRRRMPEAVIGTVAAGIELVIGEALPIAEMLFHQILLDQRCERRQPAAAIRRRFEGGDGDRLRHRRSPGAMGLPVSPEDGRPRASPTGPSE